jgi:hypothetical protein
MTGSEATLLRRREIVEALRRGTVPRRGLELFAVGLDRLTRAIDEELEAAAADRGAFKAVRGEYGSGKTFFVRWVQHRARSQGFATAEVQISESDTPLYRMETIYRHAIESLQTQEWEDGAFRALIDRWFFTLEEEVLASPEVDEDNGALVTERVGHLLEQRLAAVSATNPQFAAALRACHRARVEDDPATSEGLLGWLMAQPNVGADVKRAAGIKGDVDHRGAVAFIRGLLSVLKQSGRRGLVLVLDEVETVQRVRADSREKSLNALRQLIDDVYAGRYPGLYVVITGTPQFYDGPHGVQRLPPLAQRLNVDFSTDPAFDNSRAVQVRLLPFDRDKLCDVGRKVRDLYPTDHGDRIAERASDNVIAGLADAVAGKLGGKVGIAPRVFLRKLVGDVLDRIDEHADFDPTKHYKLDVTANELTAEERDAAGMERTVDDIALDIPHETPGEGGGLA